jgi:hypothetical protein
MNTLYVCSLDCGGPQTFQNCQCIDKVLENSTSVLLDLCPHRAIPAATNHASGTVPLVKFLCKLLAAEQVKG